MKAKNIILLLFSLLFYAWGEPRFVLLMILSITMNYGMGLLLAHLRFSVFTRGLRATVTRTISASGAI